MQTELKDKVESSYLTYSMATIIDRALPDVRDGNFPIHRRILYAMKYAKLTYDNDEAKSTAPVSETMKIHHHGDASIYKSLALLTNENETLLHPLIDGKGGSFGKVYSTSSPAHMRYTFCRLNEFAEEMFYGLDKGIIDMIGEDNGHKQPLVLNPSYPSILVKPNQGIAVGKSCSFGSFPLGDVCKLTKDYIYNKDLNVIDYILPDFSTGAYLMYDKDSLNKIYDTGKGSVTLRAKYRYDEKSNIIEVYEIPYGKTSNKICKEITDKMNIFKNITDVRNEIGFNKENNKEELIIAIDVKKNTNIEELMTRLYKSTSLESTFSYNMNCLVDYKPRLLGVKAILDNWLEFKSDITNKSIKSDLIKKQSDLHKLKGLEKVLLDIDKAVEIIRFSEDSSITQNMCDYFSIDETQANVISNIKLRKINKSYIIQQLKDIESLSLEVECLKNQVDNIEEINKIIISNLDRVSEKYSKPRLTEILYEDNISTVKQSKEDMIDDFNHYIAVSKEGYLFKYLRSTSTFKLKEGDEISSTIATSNKATILVFTDKGNCHKIFSHSIDSKLPSQLGYFLPSLMNLQKDEKIISVQVTRSYEGSLINIYEGNKLARIDLKTFKTEQKRMLLKNSLSLETPLIKQFIITEDVDILVQSTIDKVLICNTSDFNSKSSKNANGDGLIKSKNDSVVKYVEILSNIDLDQIENVDYYRGKRNGIGKYITKTDKIIEYIKYPNK